MNSSKKALQVALREVTFDPRKPGPLTTIVTANKVDYLVERAQEVLRDSDRFTGAECRARIRDAAAILAYAMTLFDGPAPC